MMNLELMLDQPIRRIMIEQIIRNLITKRVLTRKLHTKRVVKRKAKRSTTLKKMQVLSNKLMLQKLTNIT